VAPEFSTTVSVRQSCLRLESCDCLGWGQGILAFAEKLSDPKASVEGTACRSGSLGILGNSAIVSRMRTDEPLSFQRLVLPWTLLVVLSPLCCYRFCLDSRTSCHFCLMPYCTVFLSPSSLESSLLTTPTSSCLVKSCLYFRATLGPLS
jgi:hypothetical protein